jgi:hypothetical protein
MTRERMSALRKTTFMFKPLEEQDERERHLMVTVARYSAVAAMLTQLSVCLSAVSGEAHPWQRTPSRIH